MFQVAIYEDDQYSRFFPMAYLSPVYHLKIGIRRLYDRIFDCFSTHDRLLFCRSELSSYLSYLYPEDMHHKINYSESILFINGALCLNNKTADIFKSHTDKNTLFLSNNQVIGFFVKKESLDIVQSFFESPPSNKTLIDRLRYDHNFLTKNCPDALFIKEPWMLVEHLTHNLYTDFFEKDLGGLLKGDILPYVSIYNEDDVFVGENCIIEDFTVLNAQEGPIYISDNVYIQGGSYLKGPLYLGENTQV